MARKTLQERVNETPFLIKFIICVVCLLGIVIGGLSIPRTIKNSLNELVQLEVTEQADIELEPVTLQRVVDGDTIIVLDDNYHEIRVRLIGVDPPESVHVDESKNIEAGQIASAYTKSQLIQGQTLYLEYDRERLDQYERTLAYVWLDSNVDPTDINDIQTKMYNAKLIVEGYAVAKTYQPNTKYSTIFQSIEENFKK